jgi:DNA-binding CsgD family transcriptional regulator
VRHLAPAERDVLEKVAIGMTDREIAKARRTTPGSVNTQVQDIRRILGFDSRAALIRWAWRSGWMTATPGQAIAKVTA